MCNSTSEIITKEQFAIGQTVHLWEKNSLASSIFDGSMAQISEYMHFCADSLTSGSCHAMV